MFSLSKELKQKAQETTVQMEKDQLDVAALVDGVFKGFLVKEGTQELQKRKDSQEPVFLGPYTSESNTTYWITLK